MAVCDLGYARFGTRGEHSADVTLPLLRSSFKLRRADDEKRRPKGGGVFIVSAVSKKRRRRKSGAAELG